MQMRMAAGDFSFDHLLGDGLFVILQFFLLLFFPAQTVIVYIQYPTFMLHVHANARYYLNCLGSF